MSTHEVYCSLDICKLLKQAGFDWECQYYIHAYTQEIVDSIKTHKKLYRNEDVDFSAPTLDVAQRWLREVKRCIVEVNYDDCQKHYWVELFINEDDGGGIPFYGNVFAMFEEAQEAGIKKALELILEK